MELTAKVKKTLNMGLRVVVALLSLWFIYLQVFRSGDYQWFAADFPQLLRERSFLIFFLPALLLMPVNWSLESIKWRMLALYVRKLSFGEALRSVLTGISFSLFTPNRVGDSVGRIFSLRIVDPMNAVLLAVAGSLAQIIATCFSGSLAFLFYIRKFFDFHEAWLSFFYAGLVIFVAIINLLMLMLYLRAPLVSAGFHKIIKPGWQKIHGYISVLQNVSRIVLGKVVLLSFLRYLVFSFQFYLMLRAFSIDIPLLNALVLIAMTYLVMTAIPTIALADLGIRGSVAIYFIGSWFEPSVHASTGILLATAMVWIINLAVPALAGLLFIGRLTIFRK